MAYPFQNKLIVLIGTPQRCTRREVRDLLEAVCGITDDRVATFTSYAVAFKNAEKTKIYQTALDREEQGFLTILTEEQFFAVLEGRAEPPEKPEHNVTIIPSKNPEAYDREYERIKTDVLNHKRMKNLAKYGISTPEGRVKADLRLLDAARRYTEFKSEQDK